MSLKICLLFKLLCIVTATKIQKEYNETYDPLKGTFLASFQDSSGTHNCSVYLADSTIFFIDNCGSSSSFVRSLNFTFNEEPVLRVVYAPFGVLLEIEDLEWLNHTLSLTLKITSDVDDSFSKELDMRKINFGQDNFQAPSYKGLHSFHESDAKNSKTVLMNSKMIILFYFEFENALGCDAFFWAGKGTGPDINGTKVPDENGSFKPLGYYYKKTMTLRLPRMNISDSRSPEMTIYDIDYIGIFCPDTNQTYASIDTTRFNPDPQIPPQSIHPPFIFDRFFLGDDEIIMCLPNGTYSRELNFDDTKSELPCMGTGTRIFSSAPLMVLLLLYLSHMGGSWVPQ